MNLVLIGARCRHLRIRWHEHGLIKRLFKDGGVVILDDGTIAYVPLEGNQRPILGILTQPFPTVPSRAAKGARGI